MIVLKEICHICGKHTEFNIKTGAVLYREAACSNCGASIRNSDVAGVLLKALEGEQSNLYDAKAYWKDMKILNCGATGVIHECLKNLSGYACFEYFEDVPIGSEKNGIMCNDLQQLSYGNDTFDVIISEDVFKHVDNYECALRETYRVLKAGGIHVFSVPIHEGKKTKSRRELSPVYHGDPVRNEGVLVCTDWGEDIEEILSFEGFQTTVIKTHSFYNEEEITDVDMEYEDYKNKEAIDFYKYNSNVCISKKIQTKMLMKGFTGERMIPGMVDAELELEHRLRYLFARQFVIDKNVLDAACGAGYGTVELARVAKSAIGIDISEEAIEHAKQTYEQPNLEYRVCSVEQLEFQNAAFDTVISFETLEHVPEEVQYKFLKEIKRVLKQDGTLVMSTPNHEVYKERGENHYHVKELTEKEFRDVLSLFFENVYILSQKHELACMITSADDRQIGTICPNNEETPEYMIAICSDEPIGCIETIVGEHKDGSYKKLLDWAVSLHHSDIDKQALIDTQSKELICLENIKQSLLNAEGHIQLLLESERTLNNKVEKLETNIEELEKTRNSLIHEGNLKEIKICELGTAAHNYREELAARSEELIEANKEINRIHASKGWRLLTCVWKIRALVLPPNSKRAILARKSVRVIKKPISAIRKPNHEKNAIKACSGLIVPSSAKPVVSIIIPVYNQFNYTYECIKSIIKNTEDVPYEIIIADDNSTDITRKIKKMIEGITVIRNRQNMRFLLNCNNAAKYAKGKYVLFLNNDTQVQENWLSSLVNLIESDNTIGMVGSKFIYPDGRLQEAGGILWKDGSAWNYGHGQNPSLPEFNYVKEVDYISGASIMISKELWNEIGGFDERFVPAYCEDSDFAFEVRKRGYKVMYQPKSVIVHFEGVSNGTDTSVGQKAYQVTNSKKFYEKWKEVLEREHFDNGDNVIQARDRSSKKEMILVVDHYIPTYDKDAGSRTLDHYLQLLTHMGYNIKFLSDNFHYDPEYAPRLEQLGIEMLCGSYYVNSWKEWIINNSDTIDYIYLNRPHVAAKYIDFFKEHTSAKIVYYVVDLHFLREEREYEIKKDSKLLQSSKKWKKIEMNVMNKSDVVFTLSSDEQKIINDELGEEKAVINPIFCYNTFEESSISLQGKSDILFVGGFAHTPNVDAVNWFMEEIWEKVHSEIPDARIVIVGSNPPDKIKEMESESVVITGFISDEELEEYYDSCRIFFVPLRYGAGVKGKTIEAMHHRVPIVTTSIGIEGLDGIEEYISASNTAEDFALRIIELYQNQGLSEQLAMNYDKYVEAHFSESSAKYLFQKVFSKI